MARFLTLHAFLFASLMISVQPMSIDADLAEERASIMRRQRSTQIHLGPKGEAVAMDQERSTPARSSASTSSDDPPPWCDMEYKLMDEGTNECSWGSSVSASTDCGHAAQALGLTAAATDDWWTKDEPVNPSPVVKDCHLIDGKVHINNLQSTNNHGYWNGTKICGKQIYLYGSEINETNDQTFCHSDYDKIMNYTECLYAHSCVVGNMACRDIDFGHEDYTSPLAPKGCYIDHIGCYGWNAEEGSGNRTGKSAVCKLRD